MLSARIPTTKDEAGEYFIDRDGEAFTVILNFLRTERVHYGPVDRALVQTEAEFYRIPLPHSSFVWLDPNKLRNIDLEGHATIKGLLQFKTLFPWQEYTENTIFNNIAKIVKALTEMTVQKAGVFAATIALYQNSKKKDTISTSHRSVMPASNHLSDMSHLDVTFLEVIVYLEVVTQPVIELWCTYFKLHGFTDLTYTKKVHPIIHWAIDLSWNSSFFQKSVVTSL